MIHSLHVQSSVQERASVDNQMFEGLIKDKLPVSDAKRFAKY